MWPFSRHYSLEDMGFLSGATDFHCHILPGVDDGIRTPKEALEALDFYKEVGVREVWLTPHVMEDYPNEPEELKLRFEALQEAHEGTPELHLAAENMMDSLFEQRFFDGNLLPLGTRGDQLLVETSYYNPPMRLYELLDEIRSQGYFPVLAHPERYVYMSRKDYVRLRDMGVRFQLNLMSISGMYGPEAASKARRLLLEGYYGLYGSDLHRLAPFRSALAVKAFSRKEANAMLELREKAELGWV